MKRLLPFVAALLTTGSMAAQTEADTIKDVTLNPVSIVGNKATLDIKRLDPIQNTYIYSGKKTEVIDLVNRDVSLTEKYGRQIFAKIPGVFIYDMDGTGNQMNISTRGLDPHRGWEFNMRKDGIITNSDMYGYPASHYNVPMEAVERIELVRGTGSLQYGGQFGGMLNYITKQPSARKFSFESINTVGSYGLLSTYNAVSGTLGKFRYVAWFNKKSLQGYRENGESQYNSENVSLYYDFSDDLTLKVEWTHSNYLIHLAGALTDSMFRLDPRASTRSRNYYSPDIHVPSVTLDWNLSESTQVKLTTSAILGSRNSVMFDRPTTTVDTIDPLTLQYSNRQVDIDRFNSYSAELRVMHSYGLLGQTSSLAAGVQYMNNDLHRRQLGRGTTGSDYDLSLVTPGWGRNIHFKTGNVAVFAENRWQLFKGFSLNTGARMEVGQSDFTAVITNYPDDQIPNTIEHKFPLFGASFEYAWNSNMNVYGGWSQAYRPVILKDIIPGSTFERVDKNLKDAFGHNMEIGFRGNWNILKWDVTAFNIQYNNRLGTIAQTDDNGDLIIYRTNIGNSRTTGVELFLQADMALNNVSGISVFTSTSYMDARYQDAEIRSGNGNIDVSGNKVESVPTWISRNGVTFRYKMASLTALYSYTSETFADALNSVTPNANAATGLVPAYGLLDLNASIQITSEVQLRLNVNNVLDKQYFTKRPQFYPGPGIWPSDGRTISATVAIRI